MKRWRDQLHLDDQGRENTPNVHDDHDYDEDDDDDATQNRTIKLSFNNYIQIGHQRAKHKQTVVFTTIST
jgi:hypothetical protein